MPEKKSRPKIKIKNIGGHCYYTLGEALHFLYAPVNLVIYVYFRNGCEARFPVIYL